MASTAARMETPVLLAKPKSAENGEDQRLMLANSPDSNKGKEALPPVKILASSTSVTPPASGTTTDAANKASASNTKQQPSSKQNDTGTSSSDAIDSALLAALRDPRERLGLLKLEQILIDFLEKQPQDSYVDIGGPYNSTVISPTLGYIGQQPHQLQAMAQAQSDGSNSGRPQTTFQRCILHRICDRFNMTRENSYTTDAFGCYLIRVCKGPDSKKPSRRLLNVKESEYQIPRPSDNTSGNNAGSNHPNNQLSANFQQLSIASTGSVNPAGAGSGSSGKASRKVGKMKIMKRSGSNVSSGSGGSSNGKAKNNAAMKTRSTLSEKERKYEEARARIFAQEGETSAENAGENSTSNMGSGSTPAFVPGNYYNNNNRNNNDGHGGYNNSDRRGSYNDYNNNLNRQSSQSSSVSGAATGNPKAPLHNNSTTSLSSMASNNSGKGNNSDSDQQQSTAATRSKATYRNRQQEETDPDFRRGAGIQLQPNPYAQAHTPVYPGGGRGGGNVYYHNNMVAGNGNNNRAGYSYGQQQQQQQHYQYHHQQQHYGAQQHHQAYYSNNQVGGRGYAHTSMQYQQQRRQQEQHFPALSSSTARK